MSSLPRFWATHRRPYVRQPFAALFFRAGHHYAKHGSVDLLHPTQIKHALLPDGIQRVAEHLPVQIVKPHGMTVSAQFRHDRFRNGMIETTPTGMSQDDRDLQHLLSSYLAIGRDRGRQIPPGNASAPFLVSRIDHAVESRTRVPAMLQAVAIRPFFTS